MVRRQSLLALIVVAVLAILCACGTNNNNGGNNNNNNNNNNGNTDVEYTYSTYSNPVAVTTSGGAAYNQEICDPTVVRDPDTGMIYVISTKGKLFRSEDGVNFEIISQNCIGAPTWWKEVLDTAPADLSLWAPDLVKVGDQWIIYYSLSGFGSCVGIGYAVADNIEGPYTDMGKLFTWKEIGVDNAIDPHVYVEEDGSVYMSFGSFCGLFLVQLTEDGMGLEGGLSYQKSNKVLIAGKVGPWDGATYEGSYIIKKDGYYYYFGSVGTCCKQQTSSPTYHVRVGRSQNITGPYVDSVGRKLTQAGNGIQIGEMVLTSSIGNAKVQGPGHNSILIDDAGDYWMYYHAYSSTDNMATRHLFIDKIEWSNTGWPYVSYAGYDENGDWKEGTNKPSHQIEIEGPRWVL